jgi:hypothetical protein
LSYELKDPKARKMGSAQIIGKGGWTRVDEVKELRFKKKMCLMSVFSRRVNM